MTGVRPPREFNFDADNLDKEWAEWFQNFQFYLLAAEKQNKRAEVKIALLLNQLGWRGVELYNTFRQDAVLEALSTQSSVSDQEKSQETAVTVESVLTTFEQVVERFKKHFAPKKNIVHERCKFNKLTLAPGQSLIEFVTSLKTAADTCEFLERNNMIRDRLVAQVSDSSLLGRMLDEGDALTMDRAVELCKQYENRKTEVIQDIKKKKKKLRARNNNKKDMPGTRIVYERSTLMYLRNSPLSQTPPNISEFHGIGKGSPSRDVVKPKDIGSRKSPQKSNSNEDDQFQMDL